MGPAQQPPLHDAAREIDNSERRKLRVDTTAVETDIHFPTDSGLVGDGVRVVSRLLRSSTAPGTP